MLANETEITYMRWDSVGTASDALTRHTRTMLRGSSTSGWVWIDPKVQAQIDAERLRADEAERRAVTRRRGGQKRRSAGWKGWKVSLPR